MKQSQQKKRTSKKWISSKVCYIILAFLVILPCFACLVGYIHKKSAGIHFVESMGAGWNLGNSLDVKNREIMNGLPEVYETYWGNPLTTKAMIDVVRDAGFNTVRIPITWYQHMDESGNVDAAWMDRVQEVVDYVYANGMYAIIDLHHDRWFMPTYENQENATRILSSTWSQIAERFAAYDEHLVFEAMNEPRLYDTEFEWNGQNQEAKEVVNHLNAAFVEVIRTASNENKNRYLMISPYCNLPDEEALADFVMPQDDRLIVSIHEYAPYHFVMNEKGTNEWNKDNPQDTEELDQTFDTLYRNFIHKGIPVIISEFGAIDKNNLEARLAWADYYISSAREKKIMCIWWDEGGKAEKENSFKLLDRHSLQWKYSEIVRLLIHQK